MKFFYFLICFFIQYCKIGAVIEDELVMMRTSDALKELNISTQCKSDINATISGYYERKSWAIAMYDSSVKIPTGIEYGSVYQLGNFDQCMNISTKISIDGVNIQPKYCLIDVMVDGFSVRKSATRNREIKNSTLIHWAICLPSSCSNDDFIEFMKSATGYDKITVDSKKCQVNEEMKFNSTDILFGLTFMSFLSILVLCSLYHIFIIYSTQLQILKKKNLFEDIIKSFSIIENLKKLNKKSNDEHGLSCLNGIKAISMFCIIIGHALVFMIGGPMQNTEFYEKQSQQLQNAFILNSPLLVDSFLLLSGFLLTRLILIEMDKRSGKVNFGILYIFRYIRLTPAYLMMIGLYSTWLIKIGNGPLWKEKISLEQSRCQQSWWMNVLYINNYFGSDDRCMFQSWYLAVDTQLFILAPLLIYPLWKNKRIGLHLTAIIAVICIYIPFHITFTQNLDPTLLIMQDEIKDLSSNKYFIHTYGKTHMRAISYVFGILIGFFAYYIHENKLKISKRIKIISWISSLIIGIYSMFGVILYYLPSYHYSILESALYSSFHRLGWSIFTGWIVLSCVTSEKSALKSFLSSHFFVPLSRLTYCAYLTNGFVEIYLAASIRSPKYMSIISLLGETLSHIVLTFLAALILCLMFESPIHGIEKILFRKNHSHLSPPCDNIKCNNNDLNECGASTSSRISSSSEVSI